ncbi:MAG: hypothetical protein HQL82_08850 [Magnetococcales bacterium]|nr:hypothetical protein [Magnetococcales bacterium]
MKGKDVDRRLFILAGVPGKPRDIEKKVKRLTLPNQREFLLLLPVHEGGAWRYDLDMARRLLDSIDGKIMASEGPQQVPINEIYLVFQEVESWKDMLKEFRPFVFPVGLPILTGNLARVWKDYESAVKTLSDGRHGVLRQVKAVVRGVPKIQSSSYMMLPIWNFKNRRLQDFFSGFNGTVELDPKGMPRFERTDSTSKCSVADEEGKIFRAENTLQKHLDRPDLTRLPVTLEGARCRLNSKFRLGIRYDSVFHFDVEDPKGHIEGFCLGPDQPVSRPPETQPYANVHPSDLVRWKRNDQKPVWCWDVQK